MADQSQELARGIEDGAPKANWREGGQSDSQQPPAKMREKGGSQRKNNNVYAITDSHFGPHIARGEKPHTPTIGEVLRQKHQRTH